MNIAIQNIQNKQLADKYNKQEIKKQIPISR